MLRPCLFFNFVSKSLITSKAPSQKDVSTNLKNIQESKNKIHKKTILFYQFSLLVKLYCTNSRSVNKMLNVSWFLIFTNPNIGTIKYSKD